MKSTWRRAGLDRMSEDGQPRLLRARICGGPERQPARFQQIDLAPVSVACDCRPGLSRNVLLIGDALRTVHFSIGSGTRLAFEDAIALDRAFAEAGDDVARALDVFERERRPVVEKIRRGSQRQLLLV